MWVRAIGLVGLALSLACGIGKGEVDYGVCPDYIACAEATGTPTATIEATYGVDGVCWEEDDEVLCRAACEDALTVLSSTYPEEAACLGDGPAQTTDWGVDACRNSMVPGGSVVENFELVDQNGDTVTLYDFCDRAVLLVADAAWHDIIGAFDNELSGLLETFGTDNLAIVFMLGENVSEDEPQQGDLADYATRVSFSAPVLADHEWREFGEFAEVGALPAFVLLAPGAVLFETNSMQAKERSTIEDALD